MFNLKPLGLSFLLLMITPSAFAQRGGPDRAVSVFAEEIIVHDFANNIEALGTLEPIERAELTLNASDRITALYFDDGQRVEKGKTLLSLAQVEQVALLEAAEANEDEAKKQLARVRRLAREKAVSQSELDQARRNATNATAQKAAVQSRLSDRVLVAPFDGVLGFRRVSVGSFIRPGDVVATLIDDSEMRLEFSIPSLFLRSVTPGTTIIAGSADMPDQQFSGVITSIDNAIDPVTRSVSVRATLPNEDRTLKAGMFMTVELQANPRQALAVPEESIEPRGPLSFVYIAENNGDSIVARRVEVKPGLRNQGLVEILEGVKKGQMVITEGLIRVRDGVSVTIQQKTMLDPIAPKKGPQGADGSTPAGAR